MVDCFDEMKDIHNKWSLLHDVQFETSCERLGHDDRYNSSAGFESASYHPVFSRQRRQPRSRRRLFLSSGTW